MYRSIHHFCQLMLLSGLLALPVFLLTGQTARSMENLRADLQPTPDDTTRVKILFKMGNKFMDGPSDSLTHYYRKALGLIKERLTFYQNDSASNREMIKTYRRFEMRAWIELGIEYFFRSNYDQALTCYLKALEIARTLNDNEVVSECHSEIAIVYKSQGKYNLALEHNQKALDYALSSGDSSWAAVCYANQGTIYLKKGYYILALNNYLTALKTFEKLDQKRRMGACYLNVGKIYAGQGDDEQAIKYYKLALANARNTGNNINLADSYMSMGEVWLSRQQAAKARIYFDSTQTILNESGYTHRMDDCLTFIGNTYKMEQRYDKAEDYYARSLELSTHENDLPGMSASLYNMAEIEYLKHHLSKALAFGLRSLDIARETDNLKALEAAWGMLSKIYEAKGNDNKSLAAYKMYSIFKDSLFSESKYKSIREAEAKFETEKKEQQLVLLAQQNEVQELKLSRRYNLLIVSTVGILLILMISYLLIRQNRIKAKHKAIELEQRLLRSQMNPHFIFNSLIAIQSYIYKKEPVLAGDYLAKFADLVRLTLENSRVEFVLLDSEIKTLKAYLELQVLRFENKFEYEIEMDEKINTENMMMPPMFTQPFIENAIEHGLRHKQYQGHLKIGYFLKSDQCIEITIEDDGVGREKARDIKTKKQHQSQAINITKERLSILRNKHRHKFLLEVTDLKDDRGNPSGTNIRIALPYLFT